MAMGNDETLFDPKLNIDWKTFQVEPLAAVAMINGFTNRDGHHNLAIYPAYRRSVLRGPTIMLTDFEKMPKLITPRLVHPEKRYRLSDIGRSLYAEYYAFSRSKKYPMKYISVLDTIFHIDNNARLWMNLCSNGICDIWDWSSPYEALKHGKDPMILVLRVFEVDHDFKGEIARGEFYDTIELTRVKMIRPVIPDDRFEEIKTKVRAELKQQEEQVKDTSIMMQRPRDSVELMLKSAQTEYEHSDVDPLPHLPLEEVEIKVLEILAGAVVDGPAISIGTLMKPFAGCSPRQDPSQTQDIYECLERLVNRREIVRDDSCQFRITYSGLFHLRKHQQPKSKG
jgi:hypothetical protein